MFVLWICLGPGDPVHKVQVGAGRLGHDIADAFGGFTLDTLPTGGFGVACLGSSDFFLPFALHLVQFIFLFTLCRTRKRRRWRSVYEESIWNGGHVDPLDLRFWERYEVCDQFVGIASVVDRV